MKELEKKIQNIYSYNNTGVFSVTELDVLRIEEEKHNLLLAQEDKINRLNIRALWLVVGDMNTKHFHRFASHRKNISTILEIKDEVGGIAQLFKEKTKAIVDHFQKTFSAPPRCPIVEISEV